MKVAIVGSRQYTNKRKIQEFVFKLKQKYGELLEIVSGGQKEGADGYAKKYALEFDVKYSEFPPVHYSHNIHYHDTDMVKLSTKIITTKETNR